MSTNPTFTAIPRARKIQANHFDAKDKVGKKGLVAWLKGHPQITNVKNGGTWLEVEFENGDGSIAIFKVTPKFPYLVWDPEQGLLHFSEEQFNKLYRVGK